MNDEEIKAIRERSKHQESIGELHSDNCVPDIECYCDRRAIRVLIGALDKLENAIRPLSDYLAFHQCFENLELCDLWDVVAKTLNEMEGTK